MRALRKRVGELFISGFRGASPSADLVEQIANGSLGGIVLFAENCTDHERLKHQVERLQNSAPKRLFVAIDQEGGRVCRLYGKPAEYDSAESYGAFNGPNDAQGNAKLKAALERYQSDFGGATEYMSQLGINLLLGPVCDLRPDDETLSGERNTSTALSGRTFNANPDIVSEFVKSSVAIAHTNHLLCCLKHAPGLGSVEVDPHVALGASQKSVSAFSELDMKPFRAGSEAGADMLMTSHFLIPELDSAPVTFSRVIIDALIKKDIPNQTALITDDLDMGALRAFGDAGAICIAALNAGHDLLLARSFETVTSGIAAIQKGLTNGLVSQDRLIEALAKVETLRATLETVS